ncbi:MAG: guanylyltransferase [Clostridiales bacterium]|nr:guanylyltransferase [Clostridiales bacterium]
MTFDELDQKMRVYERSLDQVILPEIYVVARIDGRNFTRLTKEICKFEVPFDERFHNYMIITVKHLMDCGFRTIYGYTESDEISLLFHRDETAFNRKVRKYNSILAGEASAAFTNALGTIAAFDCRLIPLPTLELVQDYFHWRQEDAHRNSLNAYCYWLLRMDGFSATKATAQLKGESVSCKNELLFSHGVNFDKLPSWQKRGTGVYWEEYEKAGFNPNTGQPEIAQRRRLRVDDELPLQRKYSQMIAALLY